MEYTQNLGPVWAELGPNNFEYELNQKQAPFFNLNQNK